MSQALPPLNALRAFEAVARRGNFARAALELNVTPGALSHQIRGLEGLLGVALFERQPRGVVLTPSGRLLYPGLLSAFALIRESVNALRASGGSGVLVVSSPPGFTSKWLTPRLHRFAQAHPDIELRIASSAVYANFSTDGVDVAVRNIPNGQGFDPALEYEKLIDDEVVAVCSPKLMARMKRSSSRHDLRKMPLIHDDQLTGRAGFPTWMDWFRAARLVPVADLQRGFHFSSADHAIEAAIQATGLLLTHAILAHDDLGSGRLVMPVDLVLSADRAYFLVHPKSRQPRPGLDAFRVWLRTEVTAMATRSTEEASK